MRSVSVSIEFLFRVGVNYLLLQITPLWPKINTFICVKEKIDFFFNLFR